MRCSKGYKGLVYYRAVGKSAACTQVSDHIGTYPLTSRRCAVCCAWIVTQSCESHETDVVTFKDEDLRRIRKQVIGP
jgi:hypothetical protein